MATAYVGIGTNMGDRAENIKSALGALALLPSTEVDALSSIFESKPWGFTEQANFLNGVVRLKTELSPHALLGGLLGIEAAMGRVREIKNGPRIMDLDLLIYDDEVINDRELTLPHPFITDRVFVLKPLLELFSSVEYESALKNLDEKTVWLYEA